ncbi:ABC transporter permease [Aliirhizobium smilacinae]|uniref:ABC transporter permease n=1 Tax=Aliirhizobium smilacinae TaxID=1395944 RepID=A0A5C4XEB0_9HYPH|nr:ABC transporter permease [Rhizobium smilacinae]TNM61776.1 ABC transporter permease [Rhizobium smilacinae]
MNSSRLEELQQSRVERQPFSFGELIRRRPETITAALLVAICIIVAIANPAFLQPSTLVDIGRASVVMGLFALGVLVILAAGGIDVSFTAIAAFTMYSLTVLVQNYLPGLPIAVILMIATVGGALLGVINGLLVHHLKVPSLIVTIGTQYLFRGFLLSFIGTVWIMSLPPQMGAFGRLPLLQFESANGATITLPFYFLVLPIAAFVTWLILNRTLMGRAIFAMGGNANIASRLGYDLKKLHIFIFGYAGALAGLAGIIHVCANRQANPFDLVGTEINVIAAVVLGGAKITGGTGTVLGTILGVLLIVVINSVLVLVGIPSTWQRLVVGVFILLAAAFFVTRQRKK